MSDRHRRTGRWKGRACLLVCFVLALLSPHTALADDMDGRFDALVAEAVAARNAGNLERTAALLKQAIDIEPMPAMTNNLGRVYEELGRYGEAVAMYTKVAEDDEADASLRQLERERIARLAPKLTRAWVRLDGLPEGARVTSSGLPIPGDPGVEFGVDAGPARLEVTTSSGDRIHLLSPVLERGRRRVLAVALGDRLDAVGRVTWEKAGGPLTRLSVNGQALTLTADTTVALHLSPGQYVLEAKLAGRLPIQRAAELVAGAEIDLSEALAASLPEPDTTVMGAKGDGGNTLMLSTLAAGVITAGVGLALVFSAEADRQEIRDATGAGGVSSMDQGRAFDLEDGAKDKNGLGAVLAAMGGAVTLGAGGWLLWGDGAEDTALGDRAPSWGLVWGTQW